MRVAFYGRVSTDDAQDPSLSIPRQLGKCNQVLDPIGEKVGVSFWDVESGGKALAERGKGKRDWSEVVDVPRAGGLPELLASKERDIALFAADGPLNSSATAILTRRVKQGVAEWYVRDLIERSRAGMEESVRQGWHTGGPPPYGFMLQPYPRPNPQKARKGRKTHRLVVDPVRAPVMLMIFMWYCLRDLGLGTICEKLNSDLDRYPPPKRNRKDENGLPQTWSKSQLHLLLRNPKYTGYNVWGRHDKRRGRPVQRPREKWVWSATPTHEEIGRITPSGQITEFRIPSGAPTGAITAGPDGNLWFTESGSKLGRIEPGQLGVQLTEGEAMTRQNRVPLWLACGGGALGDSCNGTIRLSINAPATGRRNRRSAAFVALGHVRYNLATERRAHFQVRLNNLGIRRLARPGHLRVPESATLRGGEFVRREPVILYRRNRSSLNS